MHTAANNTDSVTHKVSTASTVQLKKLAGTAWRKPWTWAILSLTEQDILAITMKCQKCAYIINATTSQTCARNTKNGRMYGSIIKRKLRATLKHRATGFSSYLVLQPRYVFQAVLQPALK